MMKPAEPTGERIHSDAMAALLERLTVAATRRGVDLGCEDVSACLAALDHPERRPRLRVHIAGTNGKGSTSTFVEAIARRAGLRTGLFTSPHLVRLGERIRVGGVLADDTDLVAAGEAVAAVGGDRLTFFEQLTVMGLWLFARAEVDIAILEVGLGGRLDATNAVSAEIAAVTGVAFDHCRWLGDTLAEIAAEKAGIFKPGQDALIGRAGLPEAIPWLVEHAQRAGAATVTTVDAPLPADITLGLAGAHQRDNAALAVAIARAAAARGVLPDDPTRWYQGLAQAHIAGRLETIAPGVVLDGAHNPDAANALAAALARFPRPRVLVLASGRDKDLEGMLRPLWGQIDGVVATAFAGPRALPPKTLAERVRALGAHRTPAIPCSAAPDIRAALPQARRQAGLSDPPGDGASAQDRAAGTVIVAGSLFLVGEARSLLTGDEHRGMLVRDPLWPMAS